MIRERALFFLHTYTQMSGWGRVKVEKFPKNAAKHENSPPPPPLDFLETPSTPLKRIRSKPKDPRRYSDCAFKFSGSYKRNFVITEFVITEFYCSYKQNYSTICFCQKAKSEKSFQRLQRLVLFWK
jgi:hypothetical protein